MWPFNLIFGNPPAEDNLDWSSGEEAKPGGSSNDDMIMALVDDDPVITVDDVVDSDTEVVVDKPVDDVQDNDDEMIDDEPVDVDETIEDELVNDHLDNGNEPVNDPPPSNNSPTSIQLPATFTPYNLSQYQTRSRTIVLLYRRAFLALQTAGWTPIDSWLFVSQFFDAGKSHIDEVIQTAELGEAACSEVWKKADEEWLIRLREEFEPMELREKVVGMYERLLAKGWDRRLVDAILRRCVEGEGGNLKVIEKFEKETDWSSAKNALFMHAPKLQQLLEPEWTNDELDPIPECYQIWHPSFNTISEAEESTHAAILDFFREEFLFIKNLGHTPSYAYHIISHVWDHHYSNFEDGSFHKHAHCVRLIREIAVAEGETTAEARWNEMDLDEAVYKLKPRSEKARVRRVFGDLIRKGWNVKFLLSVLKDSAMDEDPLEEFEELVLDDDVDVEMSLFNWVDGLKEVWDGEGRLPRRKNVDGFSSSSSSSSSEEDDDDDYGPDLTKIRARRTAVLKSGPRNKTPSPTKDKTPSPTNDKTPSPTHHTTTPSPKDPSPAKSYISLPTSRTPTPEPTPIFRSYAAARFSDLFQNLRERNWGVARAWRLVSVLANYYTSIQTPDAKSDLQGLKGYIMERSKDTNQFTKIFKRWRRQIYSPGGIVDVEARDVYPSGVRMRFLEIVDEGILRGLDLDMILDRWRGISALGRARDAVNELEEWIDGIESPGRELFEWVPGLATVWSTNPRQFDRNGFAILPPWNDWIDGGFLPVGDLLGQIEDGFVDDGEPLAFEGWESEVDEEEEAVFSRSEEEDDESDEDMPDLYSDEDEDGESDSNDDDSDDDSEPSISPPSDPVNRGVQPSESDSEVDSEDEDGHGSAGDGEAEQEIESTQPCQDDLDYGDSDDSFEIWEDDLAEENDYQDEASAQLLHELNQSIIPEDNREVAMDVDEELLSESDRPEYGFIDEDEIENELYLDERDLDEPQTPSTPRLSDMAIGTDDFVTRLNNSRPRSAWKDPKVKKVEPLRYINRLEQPRRLPNTPTKSHQPPSPRRKKSSPKKCHACGRAFRTPRKTKTKRVSEKGGVEKLRRSTRTSKKPARFDE